MVHHWLLEKYMYIHSNPLVFKRFVCVGVYPWTQMRTSAVGIRVVHQTTEDVLNLFFIYKTNRNVAKTMGEQREVLSLRGRLGGGDQCRYFSWKCFSGKRLLLVS